MKHSPTTYEFGLNAHSLLDLVRQMCARIPHLRDARLQMGRMLEPFIPSLLRSLSIQPRPRLPYRGRNPLIHRFGRYKAVTREKSGCRFPITRPSSRPVSGKLVFTGTIWQRWSEGLCSLVVMYASRSRNCVCAERNRIGGARKKRGSQKPRATLRWEIHPAHGREFCFLSRVYDIWSKETYLGRFMRRTRSWKRGSERRV